MITALMYVCLYTPTVMHLLDVDCTVFCCTASIASDKYKEGTYAYHPQLSLYSRTEHRKGSEKGLLSTLVFLEIASDGQCASCLGLAL